MKIAFEEHGQGNPVVLLHAFPLSRKMWQPQIDSLVGANCRVILPDFPGFGETPLTSNISTMEALANGIAELLDSLKIDKAIIGGLSMGGYVTLNLFRLYPEKFSAMILADTTSFADTDEKREGRFKLIEATELKGMKAIIEEMLPNLTSDYTKSNNSQLIKQLEEAFLQTNPKGAIAALRGMAQRSDHTQILKSIQIPTLLIFGEADKVTNLEAAKNLKSNISDAKLVVLEKIGHYSNLEDFERFTQAVVDFVGEFN
jgi:pimeloyl-ACP methyl ester carboxylesterase